MADAEKVDLDVTIGSDQPYTWKDFAKEDWSTQRRIRAKLGTIADNNKCGYNVSDEDNEYFEEWIDACEEFDKKVQEGEIQDPDPGAAEGTASTSQTEAAAATTAAAAATATAAAASTALAAGGSGSGGQQPLQDQQQQVVNMPDPQPKAPAGNEIMNIPLYSGSKKEDPEIWLDCVDNAQSTFNWTPEGKIGAATRLG